MTHLNYMDLSVVNEGTDFSDRKVAAYDPNTEKMTKEQLLKFKALTTRLYPDFLDDEMCDAYVASFEETMEKDAEEVKKTSICTALFVLTVIRFVVTVTPKNEPYGV